MSSRARRGSSPQPLSGGAASSSNSAAAGSSPSPSASAPSSRSNSSADSRGSHLPHRSLAESLGYTGGGGGGSSRHAESTPESLSRSIPVQIPVAGSAQNASGAAARADSSGSGGGARSLSGTSLSPPSSDASALSGSSSGVDSSSGCGGGGGASSMTPPSRSIARKALAAVGHRATSLLGPQAASSGVAALQAIIPSTARHLARSQWENYGDPLLTNIDRRLDLAIQAVGTSRFGGGGGGAAASSAQTTQAQQAQAQAQGSTEAAAAEHRDDDEEDDDGGATDSSSAEFTPGSSPGASPALGASSPGALVPASSSSSSSSLLSPTSPDSHDTTRALSALYWLDLKRAFVASAWYSRADAILLQNRMVCAFSARMVRPAEAFYLTVTDEYVRAGGSMENFMSALKVRVGPAWDERLTPLARGFYSTARAVASVVGAGRFVGGALQLGKASVHSVIEQLMHRFDHVLGIGTTSTGGAGTETGSAEEHSQHSHSADGAHGLYDATSGSNSGSVSAQQAGSSSLPASHDDVEMATSDDSSSPPPVPRSYAAAAAAAGSSGLAPPPSGLTRSLKKRSAASLVDTYGSTVSDDERLSRSGSCDRLAALAEVAQQQPLQQQLQQGSSQADAEQIATSTVDAGASADAPLQKRVRPLESSLSSYSSSSSASTSTSSASASNSSPPSSSSCWSSSVRSTLQSKGWFALVDEVLLQNSFVQALAAIMQPAEHFFLTSQRLFTTSVIKHIPSTATATSMRSGSTDEDSADSAPASYAAAAAAVSPVEREFVSSLRQVLGASWDDRLQEHAHTFFRTAWDAASQHQQHQQQQQQQAAAAS